MDMGSGVSELFNYLDETWTVIVTGNIKYANGIVAFHCFNDVQYDWMFFNVDSKVCDGGVGLYGFSESCYLFVGGAIE